jgi:hypothetical protein
MWSVIISSGIVEGSCVGVVLSELKKLWSNWLSVLKSVITDCSWVVDGSCEDDVDDIISVTTDGLVTTVEVNTSVDNNVEKVDICFVVWSVDDVCVCSDTSAVEGRCVYMLIRFVVLNNDVPDIGQSFGNLVLSISLSSKSNFSSILTTTDEKEG